MPPNRRPTLLQAFRSAIRPAAGGGLSDADLLERFLRERDEAAFEVLVWRHGPMVWGVCRRQLPCEQDAEDAFQATFLLLVRKAHSVRRQNSLAGWLYRVAFRVSGRARLRAKRHELPPVPDDGPPIRPAPDSTESADLRELLDREIDGLPTHYRLPIVLCDLQGKTNAEAARQLGCPLGTLAVRLRRGREHLRGRLLRRGVSPATVLSLAGLAVLVPDALARSTIRTAAQVADPTTVALVSTSVTALTREGVTGMFAHPLKTALITAAALVILAGGAGILTLWFDGSPSPAMEIAAQAAEPTAQPPKEEPGVAEKPDEKPAPRSRRVRVPGQQEGVLTALGIEVKEGEKVPPGAVDTVVVGGKKLQFRRLIEGDRVEKGQLLGLIDDRLARNDLQMQFRKLESAKAAYVAAEKVLAEAEARCQRVEELRKRNVISEGEVGAARLTMERYAAERVEKREAVALAELAVEKAQTILQMHEIRSPCNGVVRLILHERGEAVHMLEPVVEIEIREDR